MEFYNSYILRYLLATNEVRQASKDHWLKCYREAIESGDDFLIDRDARMLASIALADDYIKTHIIQEV